MTIAAAHARAEEPEVRAREALVRQGRFAEVLASAAAVRRSEGAESGSLTRKGCTSASPEPNPLKRRAPSTGERAADMSPTDPPPSGGPGPDRAAAAPQAAPGVAELRAYVRAAPAVIAAALRPGGAELALSFGAALSLDLRAGARGLELTLRPASGLERAARAELPGLVDALRAHGLEVARAEVRPRSPAPPRRAR